MKGKKKFFRNFIIFALLIVLTFYILLKDQNTAEILNIVVSAKIEFIFIAIGCMILYIICEAINIGRTLKALNEKSSFFNNIEYALIGFFFSAITPAASGGQPMQIYYMYKDNISVANSTLALLINLTSMQIITIGFALISVFFNYQNLNNPLIILFIIGVGLNLSALILLLIAILSKRMSKGLINIVIKIMKFFRIKNIEAKQEKFEKELEKYQASSVYIKNNRMLMLKILLTTAVQFILYYSITYWTYCSLGLSGKNIFEIITMQSLLYATVSGIPSPGAVGVSEGAFIEIFKNIFPTTMISSAVLLNRGINFYLFVIISAIVVMINQLKEKKQENLENKVNNTNNNMILDENITDKQ